MHIKFHAMLTYQLRQPRGSNRFPCPNVIPSISLGCFFLSKTINQVLLKFTFWMPLMIFSANHAYVIYIYMWTIFLYFKWNVQTRLQVGVVRFYLIKSAASMPSSLPFFCFNELLLPQLSHGTVKQVLQSETESFCRIKLCDSIVKVKSIDHKHLVHM